MFTQWNTCKGVLLVILYFHVCIYFQPPLQAIGSSSHNASLLSRVIEAIESAPLAAIHNPQDEWSTVISTATMLLEVRTFVI